jgi:hypothetical protein
MKLLREHPHLFEVNARIWLSRLSAREGRDLSLSTIPQVDLEAIAERFDLLWLMGAWRRSPGARERALVTPENIGAYDRALPGWTAADVEAAGASGYIMKDKAMQHLLGAIRRVARGKAYVSPRMSERILARVTGRRVADDRAPFERLTDREREVFALIGRGLRTRDIARELVLQWTALPQDQPDGRPQASGWLTSPVPLEGCNRLIRSPSVERLIVRSSGTQEGTNAWEHRFNVSGRDHRGSLSTPSPASCAIVARVL